MKIAISAESTVDLSKELIEKYEISIVPFSILLGEKIGLDGEISSQEIFEYVSKNKVLPKTSAVNEYQYVEHFGKLKKSYDAIIHFSLSSEMSSAYANAVKASEQFANVFVVDSRSLSTGIALLAIKARTLAENGMSAQEIFNIIEETKSKTQASFVINKLDYLRKGGRCSSLTLLGANILQIRPQILVKNGKMQSGKKYRGNYNACVKQYCVDTLKEFPNFDNSLAFVTYTTADEEIKEYAKNLLINAGFKTVYQTSAGATISSHCGPNTLGILFITK